MARIAIHATGNPIANGASDVIEVHNLSKTYRERGGRRVEALADVSFSCAAGEVFGLLGPNGAGKTTALRVISTALKPTDGTVQVAGIDGRRDPAGVRRNIGFLSASTGLYGRLTAREVLRYFGGLFAMERGALAEAIERVARTFDLGEFLDRPCDRLSSGMKQRVNIARAVLHDPPVIVLDEPTAGLDILTSRGIIEFVGQCRAEGKTVLLSTHILDEVRKLCDRVGVIHRGRLRFCGTLDEFKSRHPEDLESAFLDLVGEEGHANEAHA